MSNFDKIDFGYLFDLLPNIPKPNVSPVRVQNGELLSEQLAAVPMRISRRNVWGWNFSPQPPNWLPEIPNVCLPACLPFGSLGFLKLGNLNDHLLRLVKGSIQIKDFILFLKKESQNSNDVNKHPKYGIKEPCVGFTIFITISLQGEVFGMRLPMIR